MALTSPLIWVMMAIRADFDSEDDFDNIQNVQNYSLAELFSRARWATSVVACSVDEGQIACICHGIASTWWVTSRQLPEFLRHYIKFIHFVPSSLPEFTTWC
jgi:hypothetical protein